jgi:hypothetical protein
MSKLIYITNGDAPMERRPPEHREFAKVWREAEKVVFSRTLIGAATPAPSTHTTASVDRWHDRTLGAALPIAPTRTRMNGGARMNGGD